MRLPTSRDWLRLLSSSLLVFAVAMVPASALAQDDEDISDDDLFEDVLDEELGDVGPEPKVYGWDDYAIWIPADILVVRPMALLDTAVGSAFFAGAAVLHTVFWDPGAIESVFQVAVRDPFDYLIRMPLGEFGEG